MTDGTHEIEANAALGQSDSTALVMPAYSQGICQDGAAILRDGEQLTIEDIIRLLKEGENAKRIAFEVTDTLYGNNLHVVGWHMYGDHEPMDKLFEENDWIVGL